MYEAQYLIQYTIYVSCMYKCIVYVYYNNLACYCFHIVDCCERPYRVPRPQPLTVFNAPPRI